MGLVATRRIGIPEYGRVVRKRFPMKSLPQGLKVCSGWEDLTADTSGYLRIEEVGFCPREFLSEFVAQTECNVGPYRVVHVEGHHHVYGLAHDVFGHIGVNCRVQLLHRS